MSLVPNSAMGKGMSFVPVAGAPDPAIPVAFDRKVAFLRLSLLKGEGRVRVQDSMARQLSNPLGHMSRCDPQSGGAPPHSKTWLPLRAHE